jgi:hypothetical protein
VGLGALRKVPEMVEGGRWCNGRLGMVEQGRKALEWGSVRDRESGGWKEGPRAED